MENELKIVFMGTPLFGLPILKSLNEKYKVVGVVCQPDKPSNRGEVKFSPIKSYALENNIPVFQPEKIKDEFTPILKTDPDIIITCAYGQIIPKDVLNYPLYGCINVHASLLPKYRGGAPIQRAIMDGVSKTGVTIMKMTERMDDGDIISQVEVEITADDTGETLHNKLSEAGNKLLMDTLPSIIDKTCTYTKQKEEDASFAWTLKKEDEHLDFSVTTREIINKIRGLNPYPGSYAILSGRIVKFYKAESGSGSFSDALPGQVVNIYDDGIGVKTSNGELIIKELQLEGKRRMSAKDFINGVVNKDALLGRLFE